MSLNEGASSKAARSFDWFKKIARDSPAASFEREKTAEKTSTGDDFISMDRGGKAFAKSSARVSYSGASEKRGSLYYDF